jgi:hypothetical protein
MIIPIDNPVHVGRTREQPADKDEVKGEEHET